MILLVVLVLQHLKFMIGLLLRSWDIFLLLKPHERRYTVPSVLLLVNRSQLVFLVHIR